MKSLCIKTNNTNTLEYLLNEFKLLELNNIYFSQNEFKHYKNSELVWKRDMGYIDGITELIKIVKIFERYWM